jgi:hypothetical protein
MASPYLIPCLAELRAEFNELNPGRDKASDGWIGDAAHQAEKSDHNPDSQGRVLAIDIDATGPWPASFGDIVESLRGDARLEYIIWSRRIASRDQGWKWRPYVDSRGNPMPDPHTSHAHFSARHDHTGGTSTAGWGLESFIELSDAQMQKIADKVVDTLLNRQVTDARPPETRNDSGLRGFISAVVYGPGEAADKVIAALESPQA